MTCDLDSTKCAAKNGLFNCTCMEGYVKNDFTGRICTACPSGEGIINGKCVGCDFGYTGFNCEESWELALTIVGSVLGGLLLITLIVLGVMAGKPIKKSSKKNGNGDIGKPYVSHFSAKAPLANDGLANGKSAFANAGVPRIPRATTNSSWERSTNLEMTPSNSRQNLISTGNNQRLYDYPNDTDRQPLGQNRAQNNPYAQSRPQVNPYAQNRAQVNPYAQSRGQANPHYMHDDGRRLN
ncbi:uncharacterized protein LOC143002164 [Genypterus blacodes]|uniref:uncharacterized protein LOC143002164 n=1 Tax=Genypterus blacodes TaxID=154954 RepID=UPI003F76CF05